MINVAEFQIADSADVIALWETCKLIRPWNDPDRDISFSLESANSTILIGKDGIQIVASAMVGHDGHRGALYYVAVDPERQKQGIGFALLEAAEAWLKSKGVWKINVLIREDNLDAVGFYKSLGFKPNAAVSMGKTIS